MSDDLISRKALIYNIRKVLHERSLFHICSGNEVFSMIMYEIDHAPTAFDKEKVINEIHISSAGMAVNMNVSSSYAEGYIDATKDIIEIVEKGGIE